MLLILYLLVIFFFKIGILTDDHLPMNFAH